MTNTKFTAAHRTAMTVASFGHPVMAYLESVMARPVPGDESRWYIKLKGDRMVAAYCNETNTVSLYECSLATLKAAEDIDTLPAKVTFEVPEHDDYIGNVLLRKLRTHYLH